MKRHEYRVETSALTFNAYGQLQQAQGVHILRLATTPNQALAVGRDIDANKTVTVFAIVDGDLVLPAKIHKTRARPDGGGLVDLACMVLA